MDYDFDGAVTGLAVNMDLVEHYFRAFHAGPIGMLHEHQVFIDEKPAKEYFQKYMAETV